jgi:uncharacterized protein YlxP (DUF503 family)
MAHAFVTLCTIDLSLEGIHSLKAKRSIIKSMITRIRKQFNVAAAEVDYHDVWKSSQIAIVSVSNKATHANKIIETVLEWIEIHYPDAMIVGEQREIL